LFDLGTGPVWSDAYDRYVDTAVAASLGGCIGALVTGGAFAAFRWSEHEQTRVPPQAPPEVPEGVAAVLSVLPSSALVVNSDDDVLKASAAAYAMGLLVDRRLRIPALIELIRQVRRDGEVRQGELELGQGPNLRRLAAHVAPLGTRLILVLVDDQTREKRVEEIRRDFVANVSHELKTPIGALKLLAEAVTEAAGDPESVVHFAQRMQMESDRIGRLVQQIIELSRLQADDPTDSPDVVSVDAIVERAIDGSRVDAEAKNITVVATGRRDEHVLGKLDQLAVALSNLVENAIVYSPAGTHVTVTVGRRSNLVEIVVTDQGVGIPPEELERIFERFYRVDPARARSTGGTGLGLSIVKHVAATSGGDVSVWSEPGEGSSFTLRLPAAPAFAQTSMPRPPTVLPPTPPRNDGNSEPGRPREQERFWEPEEVG
jgi:two-component system, OmpR family, sensor histidine kinase SenX3